MAAIEVRTRGDGCRSYRLKWRFGGGRGGAPQSVTYAVLEDARRMKGAVEAVGHLVYAEDPRVQTFELVTGQRPTSYTAPRFGEIAERYIASRTRASAISRDIYRHLVSAKLAELVNRPIEAVTDDDIQQVINSIVDRGESPKAAYELLRSVFGFAVNKGMLPAGNPAAYVANPKKRRRVGIFLTPAEADVLVRACRADDKHVIGQALGDLVEVMLGTGLRISEALGLIVADVHVDDVNAAWLDVDQQLLRPQGAERKVRRGPVKSEAGRRRVVLGPDTARLLVRLVVGKPWDAPVFADPIRCGWWTQSVVFRAWSRCRERALAAGLSKRPRIHDLRHTHAAWLITDGVPLLAVSRRLGHESIKVTADVYGHLLPEADDAIRDAVSGRLATMTRKTGPAGRRPANRKDGAAPVTRTAPVRTTGRKPKTRKASDTTE